MDKENRIRKIETLIAEILQEREASFNPGETIITTGKAVIDEKEITAVVESLQGDWLGLAECGAEFEGRLAGLIGRKHSLLVNSEIYIFKVLLEICKEIVYFCSPCISKEVSKTIYISLPLFFLQLQY